MSARELTLLPGRLAVCRLAGAAPVLPAPRPVAALVARADEVTLVCGEADAPALARVQGGWRALEVAGPLDLTGVIGVLAALTAPLAQAGISVFAVSSFDTDVLLVPETALEAAVAALRAAGHRVSGA